MITGVIMDKFGPLKANLTVSSLFLLGCALFVASDLAGGCLCCYCCSCWFLFCGFFCIICIGFFVDVFVAVFCLF